MSVFEIVGALILVLTPIVLAHELGHFIAARLCGIDVEEFGLGLPPRALRLWQHNGTLYSLNWVPLGGFVRPAGENDPSMPGGLAAAPWPKRLFVMGAGAGANFVLAAVILWLAFMIGPKATQVTAVVPNSPAMAAGFQPGDTFIEINGTKVDSPAIIASMVHNPAAHPLTVLVRREGQLQTLLLQPRQPGEYDADTQLAAGLSFDQLPGGPHLHRPAGEAAQEAMRTVWQVVSITFSAPAKLISREMSAAEARPVSVVGMGQIAGRAARASAVSGSLFPFLLMTGLISAALGITQLLPLPALDGGRMFFVLVEVVKGSRVRPEWETAVHRAGLLLLLALTVLLIVRDIIDPIELF